MEEVITSGRITMRMSFATTAGQDHMLQRCAEPHHTKPQVIQYAFIVGALTTLQVSVRVNLTTTEKNQGLHQETLRNKDPG